MINRERLITEFVRLTGFDAESYEEAEISAELTRRLLSLGLSVSQDDAGNLYALLEGTTRGEPRLFAAHMESELSYIPTVPSAPTVRQSWARTMFPASSPSWKR